MNPLQPNPSRRSAASPNDRSAAEATDIAPTPTELDPSSVALSEPFVGRWNKLVSQTNWEKGRIIAEWRASLIATDASITSYSDESWAQQVGAVTSQHVGRLRRVYERFGSHQGSYEGLFWSHFLAAIDWDDAELWLEGASRSRWSVSEMRRMRSDAMVASGAEPSRDEELITSEVDDGFVSLVHEDDQDDASNDAEIASGPMAEGPDFGDADEHSDDESDRIQAADAASDQEDSSAEYANPFADLKDLPPDVADGVEQLKLSIIRHRAAHWTDISQSNLLKAIDALRDFASR